MPARQQESACCRVGSVRFAGRSGCSGPCLVVCRYRLPFPVDLPRWDERGVPIGSHLYFPLTVVEESVVESAEQDQVSHVGGSPDGPVNDVVTLAP